jgi:replication factor C large subunit
MWVKKYTPKKVSEVTGQDKVVNQFLRWYNNWKQGSKALLFHGPPGVGKTCLVEVLGMERNLDIIELNASNYRTALQMKEVIGRSMKQKSLFKKGKIFMIDEIDGMAGNEDRGGTAEIIKMIKESSYPIVLIANDPWNPQLRSLRSYCQLIQFSKVPYWDILKRLQYICQAEEIKCSGDVLKQIAKRSNGDLRSAINDLENLAGNNREITLNDLEVVDQRERGMNVFDFLKIIFKTKSVLSAKLAFQNVDKNPEEIFWWIEQNIVNEYEKPEEIAKAYRMLSKADLFNRRTRIRQEYRLMKYMIDLMTSGIAVSKKEMYRKFTRYQYPDNIKVLGMTKKRRGEDKEKLVELAKQLHCSTRKVRSEFLPYLKIMDEQL